MMIPLGFRFEPTDEELICGFLLEKVRGGAVPWNGVVDKNIYGAEAEPWVVFSDVDDPASSWYWQSKKEGGATKNTRYVFTTLTGVSKSKRISRAAGRGGTWSGQTAPKKIKCSESGATIGVSKMFVYESTKFDVTPTSEKGHWIMHEYSLSGLGLQNLGLTACNIVLCKITRSIKKSPRLHVPLPLPPQLNILEDNYDHLWTAAEAETTSNKRERERGEGGWNQEESSSSCKKHKASDSNGLVPGEEAEYTDHILVPEQQGMSGGFADGSGGLLHYGPEVGEEAEVEDDDIIDISWLLDEMEAEKGMVATCYD